MNHRVGPQRRHMDAVKVAVSERVLSLGRVRMTYLFVTVPGINEHVWERVQDIAKQRRFLETHAHKQEHAC